MARTVKWQGKTVNRGSKKRASSSSSSKGQSLSDRVSNYERRLAAAGIDPEEATDKRNFIEKALNLKKDQNVLFDIFEVLNRPQNALFTGIRNAQKGKDFGKGLVEGITGKKDTTGKDILKGAGMKDRKGKLDLVDVLGFGLDVVADPMDLAILPATGVKATAKAAQAVSKAGDANAALKAARATGDAAKVAKASETFNKASKAADIAQAAAKEASKGLLYNAGKSTTSLTNIVGKGVGKAAKGVVKGADKAIELGLEVGDKTYANRLTKQINKAAKNLDKAQKAGDVKGIVRAQNALEELSKMDTATKGLDTYKSLKKGVAETIDSNKAVGGLVGKTRKAASEEDAATNIQKMFAQKDQEAIEKQIQNIANTKGKKAAEEFRNKVNNELMDIIEYDRDYSVKGGNILKGLGKNKPNTITEIDDKSLESIKKFLGKNNISFEDIDDGIKITQKDIGDIKEHPEMQQFFNNLNITKKHYYTPEQLEKLEAGKKYFTENYGDFYKERKTATGQLANIRRNITGTDFTGITDREGYLKRAIGEDYLKSKQKGAIDYIKGQGTVNTKQFGTRKYASALEAENMAKAAREEAIDIGEKKIASLESKKVANQLENLNMQKIDLITKKTADEKKLLKRLEKAGINKEKYAAGLNQLSEERNLIKGAFSESTINKINEVQNRALQKNIVSAQDEYFKAAEQTNKILKKIESEGSEAGAKTWSNALEKAQLAEHKAQIKLKGNLDAVNNFTTKKTNEVLKAADKGAEKYAKNASKAEKLQMKLSETSNKFQELTDSLNDLSSGLEQQLKDIDFKIDSFKNMDPSRDAAISKEISKIQENLDILRSKEGQQIFKHQYNDSINAFIDSTGNYSKGAKIYNEAITSGTLNNPEFIRIAEKATDEVPTGFVKVDGNKISKQLEATAGIIPENTELFREMAEKYADKTVLMDRSLANVLNMTNKSDESARSITKLLNSLNNTFKKFSVLTPGFQMRNMVGNWSNMYLAGMPIHSMPEYMGKATQVLNDSENILNKLVSGKSLTKAEQKSFDVLSQFWGAGFAEAGDAVRDLEQLRSAVKTSGGPINKIAEVNMDMNMKMDNINRMSLLMYANDHPKMLSNLGKNSAEDVVRFALMDPNNMSEFEKNTMKKLMPFYTFTKQNLLFQVENIVKNTPKYNKLMKALNSTYDNLDDDDAYWQYQKESMQIPLPFKDKNGNQVFLKANLPLSDLGEWMSNPARRAASSSNPLLKGLYEKATGVDTFTGQPLNYTTGKKLLNSLGVKNVPKDVTNATSAAEHLLSSLGLTNITTNMVKKVAAVLETQQGETDPQAMWSEIFRSLVQNTNQEKVENAKLYQQYEDYQALMKDLKSQGIDVPTIREMTKSNKIKVNNLKRKRAIRRNSN